MPKVVFIENDVLAVNLNVCHNEIGAPIFVLFVYFQDKTVTARIYLHSYNQVPLALPEQISGVLAINTPQ